MLESLKFRKREKPSGYFAELRADTRKTYKQRELVLGVTTWGGALVLLILLVVMIWLTVITLTSTSDKIVAWYPSFVDKGNLLTVSNTLREHGGITPLIAAVGVLFGAFLTFVMSANSQRQKNQNEYHVSLASLNTAERARWNDALATLVERAGYLSDSHPLASIAEDLYVMNKAHKSIQVDVDTLFTTVTVSSKSNSEDPPASLETSKELHSLVQRIGKSIDTVDRILAQVPPPSTEAQNLQDTLHDMLDAYGNVLLEAEKNSVLARFKLSPDNRSKEGKEGQNDDTNASLST